MVVFPAPNWLCLVTVHRIQIGCPPKKKRWFFIHIFRPEAKLVKRYDHQHPVVRALAVT
jgi:hypothetical protein